MPLHNEKEIQNKMCVFVLYTKQPGHWRQRIKVNKRLDILLHCQSLHGMQCGITLHVIELTQ